LGCVLYHLLAAQPPFPDTNLISQMVRHATETPKPLRQWNSAIAAGLQQVISTMMAKAPGQRYGSPEQAAQALQAFLTADSRAARAAEEPPQMRKYLTWLETTPAEPESRPVAIATPVTSPLPIAKPIAQPNHYAPHKKKHK